MNFVKKIHLFHQNKCGRSQTCYFSINKVSLHPLYCSLVILCASKAHPPKLAPQSGRLTFQDPGNVKASPTLFDLILPRIYIHLFYILPGSNLYMLLKPTVSGFASYRFAHYFNWKSACIQPVQPICLGMEFFIFIFIWGGFRHEEVWTGASGMGRKGRARGGWKKVTIPEDLFLM